MRAFLVLGPESSGTRLMTSLLIAAGCYGDDGHEQRLDAGIPINQPLIVWRRSVPHAGEWPQVNVAFNRLEFAGYKVTAVIMSRDWHSLAASQVKVTHAPSMAEALCNIKRAYLNIFDCLNGSDDFEIVNYEALTQRPEATVEKLFGRLEIPMPITIPTIYDGNAAYYQRPVSLERPVSQLCTQSQFEEPVFRKWLERLNTPFRYHRKMWEFAYIAQALELDGMLQAGWFGLGFGVGQEPLPALFASCRINVLATDQETGGAWASSGQYSAGLEDLPYEGICSKETLNLFVRHKAVDMNHIPPHLRQGEYDFVWSAGSLDHLGTIEAGLQFIHNSMECLRPGGLAVHVTEFNTDSNDRTLDRGPVVLFRERDIRRLAKELTEAGYEIELNLSRGNMPIDLAVDRHPYRQDEHIRLVVGGHVTTSIGLIIRKGHEQRDGL